MTARSITDRDPGKILVVEEDGEATGALLIIPEHSFTRTFVILSGCKHTSLLAFLLHASVNIQR